MIFVPLIMLTRFGDKKQVALVEFGVKRGFLFIMSAIDKWDAEFYYDNWTYCCLGGDLRIGSLWG